MSQRAERVAVVTLAIGSPFVQAWQTQSEPGWRQYANRHGFDVICIDEPLDASDRASRRSPAWQKCLVLSQPFSASYDRIVWVDADVAINPAAPAIVNGVPPESVGGVSEFAQPHFEQTMRLLAHQHGRPDEPGGPLGYEHDPRAYYRRYGLPDDCRAVLQTGVMVLSPRCHRELLEHTYHAHEDRGDKRWHYEMRPLSYEIVSAGLACWIDGRFNQDWTVYKTAHCPSLLEQPDASVLGRVRRKLGTLLGRPSREALARRCAAEAFEVSHFLHFAGARREMAYLDQATPVAV